MSNHPFATSPGFPETHCAYCGVHRNVHDRSETSQDPQVMCFMCGEFKPYTPLVFFAKQYLCFTHWEEMTTPGRKDWPDPEKAKKLMEALEKAQKQIKKLEGKLRGDIEHIGGGYMT